MATHVVIVELQAKPGKRADLLAAWHDNLEAADVANPDLMAFIAALDDADEDRLRLIEVYHDASGFDRVMGTPEVAAFLEAAGELLGAPPSISRSTAEWAKNLDIT